MTEALLPMIVKQPNGTWEAGLSAQGHYLSWMRWNLSGRPQVGKTIEEALAGLNREIVRLGLPSNCPHDNRRIPCQYGCDGLIVKQGGSAPEAILEYQPCSMNGGRGHRGTCRQAGCRAKEECPHGRDGAFCHSCANAVGEVEHVMDIPMALPGHGCRKHGRMMPDCPDPECYTLPSGGIEDGA